MFLVDGAQIEVGVEPEASIVDEHRDRASAARVAVAPNPRLHRRPLPSVEKVGGQHLNLHGVGRT